MTRIIAGRHGGRLLRVPAGSRTRPTSDRVREALFSALQARGVLDAARVLDLYAGSGALGLEALSRGASDALFVEADRQAARVITANLAALGETGGRVRAQPVQAVLGGSSDPMDLVLLDPPYDLGEEDLAADVQALLTRGWLAPDALVIVERSSRSPEPAWPEGLSMVARKRYGETTLWFTAC